MTSIDLVSPFPRTECVRRLRERVGWRSSVAGHVGDVMFRLHKVIRYRNSFQTYMVGNMVDDQEGTLIRCRFGPHPLVIGFMIFWFVGFSLIGLRMLVNGSSDVRFVFFLLVMAGAFVLGRAVARNEKDFLTEFLQEVLEARFS
jgi:hypothetical protein